MPATTSQTNISSICPSERVTGMTKKNSYSVLLIIELYSKCFTQPCYAASVWKNTRKPFNNIFHRNGSDQLPQ